MKVECTQCGAEHVIVESRFFLRCSFCGTSMIVNPPPETPVIVDASVNEEYVRRLFQRDMVLSVDRKYFPYVELEDGGGRRLLPCFRQPWQELEDYTPPSGDRKLFDAGLVEPEQLIPFRKDQEGYGVGRVVFHPFYLVMLKLRGYGEGILVDGVSGSTVGEIPQSGEEAASEGTLYPLFVKAFLAGLVVTVPLFLLSRTIDPEWFSGVWIYGLAIAGAAAFLYLRWKGGGR